MGSAIPEYDVLNDWAGQNATPLYEAYNPFADKSGGMYVSGASTATPPVAAPVIPTAVTTDTASPKTPEEWLNWARGIGKGGPLNTSGPTPSVNPLTENPLAVMAAKAAGAEAGLTWDVANNRAVPSAASSAQPTASKEGDQSDTADGYIKLAKQFSTHLVGEIEKNLGITFSQAPRPMMQTAAVLAERYGRNVGQAVAAAQADFNAETQRHEMAAKMYKDGMDAFQKQYAPVTTQAGATTTRPGAGPGEVTEGQRIQHDVVPVTQGGSAFVYDKASESWNLVTTPEQRAKGATPQEVKDLFTTSRQSDVGIAYGNLNAIASGSLKANPSTGKPLTPVDIVSAKKQLMMMESNKPAADTFVQGGHRAFLTPQQLTASDERNRDIGSLLRRGGGSAAPMAVPAAPSSGMVSVKPPGGWTERIHKGTGKAMFVSPDGSQAIDKETGQPLTK